MSLEDAYDFVFDELHCTQYLMLINGCWVWDEALYKGKYVRLTDVYGEREYLHRVIAEKKYGKRAMEGHVVKWTCGDTTCIHPEHIYIVERGSERYNMKLTAKQISQLKNEVGTHAQVAKKYGISRSYVIKIRNGERALHIDAEVTPEARKQYLELLGRAKICSLCPFPENCKSAGVCLRFTLEEKANG